VHKSFPEYELHIYGEGEEKENLVEYITKKRITEKVFLDGFFANIHEEIKDAAMYVSTSNYEGMSNSMLEALALGIPTICTDCPSGGARMVITNGVNGLLIPVGDEKALIEAMFFLIENPKDSARMSINGEKIVDRLSEKKIVDKWEKYINLVYKRTLKK
jgi:glycosyltransferase involved in cell wall biosynthesis